MKIIEKAIWMFLDAFENISIFISLVTLFVIALANIDRMIEDKIESEEEFYE